MNSLKFLFIILILSASSACSVGKPLMRPVVQSANEGERIARDSAELKELREVMKLEKLRDQVAQCKADNDSSVLRGTESCRLAKKEYDHMVAMLQARAEMKKQEGNLFAQNP